jgi:GGDEF domain-containing protein
LIEVSARNRLILGRQFERESAAYKSLNNIVGRLGGEELAISLEGSNLKAAVELAEHLRTRIAALAFDTGQGGKRDFDGGEREWTRIGTAERLQAF